MQCAVRLTLLTRLIHYQMIACIVMSIVTCLAEETKLPFKSDIVQFWSTLLVKPLIKTVGFYFLSYSIIVNPNLLTQVQTLAAMGVILMNKFE